MYAGRVVERATAEALFAHPRHPYTAGLLRSVPSYGDAEAEAGAAGGAGGAGGVGGVGGDPAVARRPRLVEIKGMVPPLTALPKGCKFVDRCEYAQERCRAEEPALVPIGASQVRCHFPLAATVATAATTTTAAAAVPASAEASSAATEVAPAAAEAATTAAEAATAAAEATPR